MRISIICVGRIKEKFYSQAVEEYAKRLSGYCKTDIIEVKDEATSEDMSEASKETLLKKEADRILAKMNSSAYTFTLEIKGRSLSSEELAESIQKTGINGISHLQFIIGGSLGLHPTITEKADFHLSFSKMTFPHQLMRVILMEQVYRSFRIINGEPYHK